MRRLAFSLSFFLAFAVCASLIACAPEDKDRAVTAANSVAAAAQDSPIPVLQVAGTIASLILGGFGLKRATTATRFTESPWTPEQKAEFFKSLGRDDLALFAAAVRSAGYKFEGPA